MTGLRWSDPEAADHAAFAALVEELRQWPWQDVPCAVCGEAERLSPACEKHGIGMKSCDVCGNVFVCPAIPPQGTALLYSDRYWRDYKRAIGGPTAAERIQHDIGASHTKMHRDVLPFRRTGRLLDVGASTGAVVKTARECGFEAYGIEPSVEACRLAIEHVGVELHCGTLDDNPYGGGFDVVMLADVLEHVPEPRRLLQQIHEVLVPGGIVAIETPTTSALGYELERGGWPMVLPLEHINLFNEHCGELMLHEAGFRILDLYSPHDDNWIAIGEAQK